MKAEQLRGLSEGELLTKLDETYEELMNLRFNLATGQQRNHRRLTEVKRDIARLQTLLRERQLAAR